MKKDLKKHIRECYTYQRVKTETCKPAGLLRPLPIPVRPWLDISINFVEGLPKSQQKDVILVVVYRFSKYVQFIPLAHPYTASRVAALYMEFVFKLHWMPSSIVSDIDPIFTSHFWTAFMKLQGVKLAISSASHPQTDGQTKVGNKSLEQYLMVFAADKPLSWVEWLPLAEYWFNTNFHTSTNLTPFEVLYGYPPLRLLDYMPGTTKVVSWGSRCSIEIQAGAIFFTQVQSYQCSGKNEVVCW